ncbi:tyrosine-type recombinase/integrase [Deinococcus sp.]|uniref:tyrosine-type recombinase/integrase n=1 Tax=Deinococcus sp. TaxID=47478 RepID=UPI003B58DF5A
MARAKAQDRKAGNGRGSLDKLPSGMYRWRITVGHKPDGTPIRKSGAEKNETAAHKAMTQALADHLRGGVAVPDKVTLGEWLGSWLTSKRGQVAAKTYANYENLIRLHLSGPLSLKRLQDVRPADLSNLYRNLKHADKRRAGLIGQDLGDSLKRQVHNVLHGAFSEALRLELIMRDPTAVVRPIARKRGIEVEPAKALTAEEVSLLLPRLRESRWGGIFEFMLQTGLRRGEACALRWASVDLEKGVMSVRENLVIVNGRAQLSPPKTAKSARTVYLSPDSLALLSRQAQQQEIERSALGEKWQDSGAVFTGVSGVRLNPTNLKKYLVALCQAAGIREVTVHGLRHTHASLMLRRGVPLEVVSERLGHSRASFTADVYRTVYDAEHAEWAVNLSELVNPRPRSIN